MATKIETVVGSMMINGVEYVRKDTVKAPEVKSGESLYKVGNVVLIRTVTYHYVGVITYVSSDEVVMENVSWVADSGRWGEALKSGSLKELEVYGPRPVSIGRGTIVDMTIWSHELPKETK